MNNDKPVIGWKCIYQCPNKSLSPGIRKFIVIQEGFDVKRIQETLPWDEPVDVATEAAGLLWLGVKRYRQNTSDIEPSSP